MKTMDIIYAEELLRIQAIKVQPQQPFTWASGWLSPFYCDNRKTLSYPNWAAWCWSISPRPTPWPAWLREPYRKGRW